ncbi:hemerythrin domain-containing protein [Streptomyces sp. NPDC048045]|uniref:hemerythrin domain-containing protein n=1 Tax=Streptomyces sp. NPDC048045 TaxID=3154710 RepID=UPI003447D5C7
MASSNASGSTVHPCTRETAMIHQVFRRESRPPAELVQDVRPADTARARILAEHWRLYAVGLHAHHTGEDEMLWPVLLPPRTSMPSRSWRWRRSTASYGGDRRGPGAHGPVAGTGPARGP